MGSRIVVFGAGGRAGRRVVAEAAARGHRVTAVVRDPARYPDLPGDGVDTAAGDVTDADAVAALAADHEAAVHAAVRLDVPSREFFTAAARALVDGLARAGVPRLVAVGVGSVLETAPGTAFHDAPGYPAAHRDFSLGHVAQLDVLRTAGPSLDWLVLAPPPAFLDHESGRTGRYRTGGTAVLPAPEGAEPFRYADIAVAVVDEIETPRHHRALVAIGP